jgi:release factor glutamine methyltransferase
VCAAVERLGARLREAGVPEPELSSRYLVSLAVGGQRQADYLSGGAERRLSGEEAGELSRLLNCRLARMPLQYIAGNWDFRGITLFTRPPVFIPRQVVDP